jgi:hypothetical protein
MAAGPQLNVHLIGEESTTLLNQTISWVPTTKVEASYLISSASSAQTVSYANVPNANIKTIIFVGDMTAPYKVNITASAQTISFETNDFFIFSPTPVFAATITAITLTTTSTNAMTIMANIYGQQV